MKATCKTGATLDVVQIAIGCVRDQMGNVYAHQKTIGATQARKRARDVWMRIGGHDVIETRWCECQTATSPWPGAFFSNDYDLAVGARCDLCKRYEDDGAATEMIVMVLNARAGPNVFAARERDVYPDLSAPGHRVVCVCIGPPDDIKDRLTRRQLKRECKAHGIDTKGLGL